MTTLTERVARAIGAVIDASGQTAGDEALAEAAIREVLAAMREHPFPDPETDRPHGSLMFGDDEMPGWWCSRWLDAFAREHGLDLPAPGDPP